MSRRLLLIAALLGVSVPQLYAGAWNQPPGHGQLIFTSSFFQSSDTFDASGSVTPFNDGGRFRQVLLNPYFEIGLSRRYSLVVNGNAPLLKFSNTYGSQSSAGLGDMEVGLKRRLNSNESPWAVSGQLTTMFPAYSANRNPAPGNHQEDVEARILIGRGTTWSHRNFFWDTEAAYRYRSGAPADQFRGDATAGINLTQRVMVMGQIFSIKSLRNGSPFDSTNPNAQSDFDLYKSQASVVVSLRPSLRLHVGWSDAFSGRNTGKGHSAIFGIWKSF